MDDEQMTLEELEAEVIRLGNERAALKTRQMELQRIIGERITRQQQPDAQAVDIETARSRAKGQV